MCDDLLASIELKQQTVTNTSLNIHYRSSGLHRASIVSKTIFIVPNDAHYYKIVEMLKQFIIVTLAPTCLGSSRYHHQGTVLCYTTGSYAAIILIASILTSTEKSYF